MEGCSRITLFYELCRLCLDIPGRSNIFEIDHLVQDVFAYTGVKVLKTDNLPTKICDQCLDVITNAKELKRHAMVNDSNLRFIFNQLGEEICKDYPMDSIPPISNSTNLCPTGSEFINKAEINESNIQHISVRNDSLELSPPTITSTSESNNRTCKRIEFEDDILEYQCDICEKIFENRKKLYIHKRCHNKNFVCSLGDGCDKKFATKGDLQKHIRTHTGEKPYRCNICGSKFSQRGTLRLHVTTVHPNNTTKIFGVCIENS